MNAKQICLLLLHTLCLSTAQGQQAVTFPALVRPLQAPQFVAKFAEPNERRDAAILATRRAVELVDGSPYAQADRTLLRFHDKLLKKGLPAAEAARLTYSHNRSNDREMKHLVGRWVEINGIPYQIMLLRPSVHLVGAEEIVVRETTGAEMPITPQQVDFVRILPFFYDASSDYVPASGGGQFRHYGPPRRSVYLPEDDWKYELVYDPVTSLWTDGKSVAGHRWWAYAHRLWTDLQVNP